MALVISDRTADTTSTTGTVNFTAGIVGTTMTITAATPATLSAGAIIISQTGIVLGTIASGSGTSYTLAAGAIAISAGSVLAAIFGPFIVSNIAPTGFQTFGTGIGDTNTTYYTVTDGYNWLDIYGTYTASTLSLSVINVISCSQGFTAFNTYSKQIFCTIPASKYVYRDISNNIVGGLTSSSGGLGYATGTGGTVTQLTNRTTAVVLSKLTGQITLFGPTTLGAVTATTFTLTNTLITATDIVHVQHVSGGTLGLYNVTATPGAGFANIIIRNNSAAASASETPVIQFVIIKGVTA